MKHPATYIAALAALLLALALPAASFAQTGSGVDEYSEGVPGSGGEDHGGSSNGNGNSLPSSTQTDLSGAGADGAALSNVAQATAPDSEALNDATKGSKADDSSGGSDKGSSAEQGKGGLGGVLNAAAEGTGLSAIADAAGGSSDGMGVALPLLLLTAVMLAVLFAFSRARRS